MTAATILVEVPRVLVAVMTCVLTPLALRAAALPRLASTRLGGDCGIWVPLSETIDVWSADDPAAPAELRAWAAGYSTIARHDLWLCGVHYLTLEYAMRAHQSR